VGAFGDKFRTAREKKNISLEDVSNVTKISSRMLQAIEQEHFDQLPGGVFNKGFIRAYAKHLGLNDEEAVTDYLACLRQAQIDAHEVWEPATPVAASNSTKQTRPASYQRPSLTAHPPVRVEPAQIEDELPDLQLPRAEDVRPPRRQYTASHDRNLPWGVLAVTAVILLFAISLWIRHSRGPRTQAAAPPPRPTAVPTVAVATSTAAPTHPSPAPAKSATRLATATHNSAPPHAQSTPPLTSQLNRQTIKADLVPPGTAEKAETNQEEKTEEKKEANHNAGSNQANQAPTDQATTNQATTNQSAAGEVHPVLPVEPPVQPAAASLTLVIRAAETSWISVTADGQPVTHETLIAPAVISVHASRQIVARIGNAAGVTFLWNGQEIPAQGAEAEVKTFLFDAQGIREVPNQPPAQTH